MIGGGVRPAANGTPPHATLTPGTMFHEIATAPDILLLVGAMAFAVVGQVGDAVPLTIGVVAPRSSCPLQTDIGEMWILQADKVFELCVSCGSGESSLRGRLSLVPRPTHA